VEEYSAASAKAPERRGGAVSTGAGLLYQAEVAIEERDKKAGQQSAERGIKAGEKALSLKPDSAEYYRLLGTLYGQAIVDIPTGLNYGAKAKEAINKAVEKAPKSSSVYVARGVGTSTFPRCWAAAPSRPSTISVRRSNSIPTTRKRIYGWA